MVISTTYGNKIAQHYVDTGDSQKEQLQKISNESVGEIYPVATLKYSVWSTGQEMEVSFFCRNGVLRANISNLFNSTEKWIASIPESQIFHTGWFRSDCVSNMEVSVKNAFIKNLAKMKISNITKNEDVYVYDPLW